MDGLTDEQMKQRFAYRDYVDAETLCDVLCTAVEGGIGYWCMIDNTTEDFKETYEKGMNTSESVSYILIAKKGKVILKDTEGVSHSLSLEKLLSGISLNALQRPFDCDLECHDTITADCIIQYAIFGRIVYND